MELYGQGLQTFDELLTYDFTSTDSLELRALDAKKEYLLKDKGFYLTSSAGSNEFGDLGSDNVFRLKAGLEWNILDEGYMDRKLSGKIIDIEKAIKEFELKEASFDRNYSYLFNHIIYSFNKEKLKYLEEKSFLLNILHKRYETLYHAHAAGYQDLINMEDQIQEMALLNLAMSHYNDHYERMVGTSAPILIPHYLPVLDIRIDDLLSFQVEDTTFQEIRKLKLEKNEIQAKQVSQKRLAVYNNIYLRPLKEPGSSKFLYNSVGIRFRTSIANRSKANDRLNDLYDQIDVQKHEEIRFNDQKELSNYLLDYYAKLRTYSRFLHQVKTFSEDTRLEKGALLVNYESPQSDLKKLKIDLDRLSAEYELLELKQQLYLLVLKIFKKANVPSILPFVSEKKLDKVMKKLKGDRALVMDGVYRNKEEFSFLIEYIKKNEFYDIILKDLDSVNSDFKKELILNGIRTYSSVESLFYKNVIKVPVENFNNRIAMEYWIEDHYTSNGDSFYLINNINELLTIDSFVLEE